jgi:hypothetical protein
MKAEFGLDKIPGKRNRKQGVSVAMVRDMVSSFVQVGWRVLFGLE